MDIFKKRINVLDAIDFAKHVRALIKISAVHVNKIMSFLKLVMKAFAYSKIL